MPHMTDDNFNSTIYLAVNFISFFKKICILVIEGTFSIFLASKELWEEFNAEIKTAHSEADR